MIFPKFRMFHRIVGLSWLFSYNFIAYEWYVRKWRFINLIKLNEENNKESSKTEDITFLWKLFEILEYFAESNSKPISVDAFL